MKKEQEKRCFIITPIGSDTDPIRRHIEGIMEAAIRPALGEKYELIVAHKIYEPGSITKQIISEIYNAELVIANLTNRNPNVMYELAFRHSLGKPVIMIAESGTSLPSDIIMERTIFYQNDAQGVIELKKNLEKAENEIDFSKSGSPIYDVLHSIDRDINILQISQNDTQAEQEVLPYILEKLNKLEDMILSNRSSNNTHFAGFRGRSYEFSFSIREGDVDDLSEKFWDAIDTISEIVVHDIKFSRNYKKVNVIFSAPLGLSEGRLFDMFGKALSDAGIIEYFSPLSSVRI